MIGLVTGANRGLGYELVKEGLQRGHRMLAACRKGAAPEYAADLLALQRQYPEALEIVKLDVTDAAMAEAVADGIKEKYGKLDFVINNAGVLFETKTSKADAIAELNLENFRRTLDVNVTGTAIVLKYCIGLLYASEDACIMNITSEAGHLSPGGYQYLAYSVSKHAANMYTQQIRNYLAEVRPEKKIRVFMVHPGRMDTVMGRENAQISPREPALGLMDILERKKAVPDMEVPFINYKGEPMPY